MMWETLATARMREAVIEEARTWIGTPYIHEARVKGVGVDCVQLLIAVYSAVGLIESFDPAPYPTGVWLRDHRYLEWIQRYATLDALPAPARIAMFRQGRGENHSGIIVEWPRVIHIDSQERVVLESTVFNAPLSSRRTGIYYRVPGC